jgi:hypothetical protein
LIRRRKVRKESCFVLFCFYFWLSPKAREEAKSGLVLFHEAMEQFTVYELEKSLEL